MRITRNKLSKIEQEDNPCKGVKNICIIVEKNNHKLYNKRNKLSIYKITEHIGVLSLSNSNRPLNSEITKQSSMPELNESKKEAKLIGKNSDIVVNTNTFVRSDYVVNIATEHRVPECLNPFNNTLTQGKLKIYRCQLNTKEETCCCSCNSDAMFEVMKSLYDCYKMKNCDHCNCILCGHLPKEERRLGEMRKSVSPITVENTRAKEKKKKKLKKSEKALVGKTPAEKEKILRDLALAGNPVPEGKTLSEKELVKKVKAELGLPPEMKDSTEREKSKKAEAAGVLVPLEGKTPAEKEKILRKQADIGIALPEGRTPSEKVLIQKVKTDALLKKSPSEKVRKAKEAGLLTPLEGKTPEQKQKILRGLAMRGVPLPEAKTASEKKLIDKIRKDVGLPPEPKTSSMKDKYKKAMETGIMTPLEGKSSAKKEKVLKTLADLGIPLPEGRTPSEKALIAKVKATSKAPSVLVPSEKIRKAKAAGLLTPLKGKTPEQKEKILKGLATEGIPLPDPKTSSEKKLVEKVRTELGLPPEPKTEGAKEKYKKAMTAGIITPLEGKTPTEKEKILKSQAEMGLQLPEGRTASEKALITKVKASVRPPSEGVTPAENLRKAKAAGILTPLDGKTPEQKEKNIKGLAMHGLPLPDPKTQSDKKLNDRVRTELGLTPEPKTAAEKEKYAKAQAAGLIQPLEGKTSAEKEKILNALADSGIPLPEGRTSSEKALIANVKASARGPPVTVIPSEKFKKARATGVLTPLEGKTPVQKEKILKGIAMHGIPLPEGKTPSEKKIIDKVRTDLGLPPEPKTISEKEKYNKGISAGVVVPLEGKTPAEKEKILKAQAELGIPLPDGRTSSEESLIHKIKAGTPRRKTKTRGISVGKPALPPEKIKKLDEKTAKNMKEGKGPSDECICAILTPESERIPLKPKVSKLTPHKITSEKLKAAKAAGLLTPLEGKTLQQKKEILKGLAKQELPLPEGKTVSEKKLIDKVRADMGLPPEPKTPSAKEKYAKAQAAGIITPLEGKTSSEKEKILKAQAEMGLSLPEGRTPSEKTLINKVKATIAATPRIPSENLRKAKAAGLLTPLSGKTPEQKQKILRGRVVAGLPLPEGKTPSEKELIKKVKAATGYVSPIGRIPSTALTKLDGKSPSQKEKILRSIAKQGLQLPEGRTPSEKALIAKVKGTPKTTSAVRIPSEKLRKAKAAGLLTPLEGKTPAQKEKVLKGLVKAGIPLPEGKTPSDKELVRKVRVEAGLPPEPTTPSLKEKYKKAQAAGIITPLEGKTTPEKEKILKRMHEAGIPLPEGRNTSERSMVRRIKTTAPPAVPSEKLRAAKAAGLLTPLSGKTSTQKEKILKGLVKSGIPLPEGKSPSEKELIKKVRKDMGLPQEPKSPSVTEKTRKAYAAGLVTPLEGKTPAQKEKILKGLAEAGAPLPEGRTNSEKALISKVQAEAVAKPSKRRVPPALGLVLAPEKRQKLDKKTAKVMKEGKGPSDECICGLLTSDSEGTVKYPLAPVPSKKLRKAKTAGLLTPLAGKTPAQREKIIKGLAMEGLPLPEGKTASEKKIINKVRTDLGLPPEPNTSSVKKKYDRAQAAGAIIPLEGKTPAQKETILKDLAKIGIPLPEGRTSSEKALIKKVKAEVQAPSSLPPSVIRIPSEKAKKAKAAGLLTPIAGKTQAQKYNIIKGLAMEGLPLPEAKTASEQKIIDKVRTDLGLPPEPKTPSEKRKYNKALGTGAIIPLEGKTPAQKDKILRDQAKLGIPLPEGRTSSEKSLIDKVRKEISPPQPSGVSVVPIPSEKLRKAKAAGLLTPLEGKSSADKEKILRGLAEAGVPLPEGKTKSDKAMIQKVKTEKGIPPVPKPQSEKEVIRKAKTEGILTPLTGKTPAQKEKLVKGLIEAGLPIPEGGTPSEKELVKKVRTAAGLPSELTPSEKIGKIKTKSKKIGAGSAKRSAKGISVGGKPAGIVEEFQDILKTTTCDRGCGCDKKKIRFKHSYVKIRVTSPDISSLCPCPNECIPGVKNGVFTDNEGIKVTVGRAVGVPSFSIETPNYNIPTSIYINDNFVATNSTESIQYDVVYSILGDVKMNSNNDLQNVFRSPYYFNWSEDSLGCESSSYRSIYPNANAFIYDYEADINSNILNTEYTSCENSQKKHINITSTISISMISKVCSEPSGSSFESIYVIKTESSLSLSRYSKGSIENMSVISLVGNSIASDSGHFIYHSQSETVYSHETVEENEYFTNIIDYSTIGSEVSNESVANKHNVQNRSYYKGLTKNTDMLIFRVLGVHINNLYEKDHGCKRTDKPILVINDWNSEHDIRAMIDEITAKKLIEDVSSVFIVVSSSDGETECSGYSSTVCIQMSERLSNWNNAIHVKDKSVNQTNISSKGFKIAARGKTLFMEKPKKKFAVPEGKYERKNMKRMDSRDTSPSKNTGDKVESHAVSLDTTCDRPCCCQPKVIELPQSYLSSEHCVASVVSELVTPIIMKQGIAQGLDNEAFLKIPGIGMAPSRQTIYSPIQVKPTPVRSCIIPPCSGHSSCHDFGPSRINATTISPIGQSDLSHPCQCRPDNLKGLPQSSAKKCTGVGYSSPRNIPAKPGDAARVHAQASPLTPIDKLAALTPIKNTSCATCDHLNFIDGKKKSCFCSGKEKRVKIEPKCPCQVYERPSQGYCPETKSVGCQCDTKGNLKGSIDSKNTCICKNKKNGMKNVLCECPEVPELEEPFSLESTPWIDEKVMRKMKSNLTQTTSGFKLHKQKRMPLEEEMSYEDIMNYYKAFPVDDEFGILDNREGCDCDLPRKKAKDVECECPYEPPLPESAVEIPLKGLKFYIGGKGSGSKGLSGICCFDMVQESK